MKTIYVLLVAILTGAIGIGIGLLAGGRFVGRVGFATGSLYSVCILTETAKESGILTQEQTDELLKQFKEKAISDLKLSSQGVDEAFSEINCSQVIEEMRKSSN